MTTLAFRDGVMAADSRSTTDGGLGISVCTKIVRKRVGKKDHIVGFCGDVCAGMMFTAWYGTENKDLHDKLIRLDENTFDALVWDGKTLMQANFLCHLYPVTVPYYAMGSGSAHAITAMDCGRSAAQAVALSIKRDSNSGGRIITMSLSTKETPK